ncbi:CDP-glycerol glycerophosphotransferase family protein [Arthrobacter monumenti]
MGSRNYVKLVGDKLSKAKRYESYAFWSTRPVKENTVVYESFSGNGMLCNPEAIFQTLLRDSDLQHLKHIWVLANMDRYRSTIEMYRNYPNVVFVEYKSDKYYKALATSQYLINNATFPWQFSKRDGQTYINTWHGTPLKCMGYDVPGGGPDTRNIIRNFVAADFLLSANEFMTKQMYLDGYKLKNIFQGRIIEEGYPRIDYQFTPRKDAGEFRRRMQSSGVILDDRKVILYAPTWKGESFYRPLNDAIALKRVVEQLESRIDTSKYRVLLKTHQVVFQEMETIPELAGYLVPNEIPTNMVLGATDVLITDYSSLFYDFLASGKPILFHLPDLDQYSAGRGLYLSTDELPGPLSNHVSVLADNVNALDEAGPAPFADEALSRRYECARQRFCGHEDGQAAARVVDIVFKNDNTYEVYDDFSDGRESILIYLGGMQPNGITTSALNLLNNIDHERYDVSAFYSYSRTHAKKASEAAINDNVRLFPREGGLNGNKLEHWFAKRHQGKGRGVSSTDHAPDARIWKDEWSRCFGNSKFDYIVDFSGYGPFWDYILLNGDAKTHSIWLHNDVRNDSERTVDGKRPLKRGLEAVFSTFPRFDRLVSVSEALREVNQPKLAEHAPAEKFVAAANTVDAQKVRRQAFGDPISIDRLNEPAPIVDPIRNLRDAIVSLKQTYPLATVSNEVQRQKVVDTYMPERDGVTTFVTVGRLSPEKNHARLLRAFAAVHIENPATRLVIVGSGPLAAYLRDVAAHYGLNRSVTFAGQQPNAAALMAAADCMVVSSDYEGQPMVILEALILGLPVLTTAFGSAKSALPDGMGLIVEQDDEALAEGMRKAIQREIPTGFFDADAYNRRAMDEFYRAIGAVNGA